MSEMIAPIAIAVSFVMVAAIVCGVALAAWRGWLDLKRLELGRDARSDPASAPEQDPAALIELASVRERLRRLEAIASGVEL
ncbi:MAG TPA: hypothetical protein VGB54_06495 [Allosphingosinicella sp.]|jgi:hypothetical protein